MGGRVGKSFRRPLSEQSSGWDERNSAAPIEGYSGGKLKRNAR